MRFLKKYQQVGSSIGNLQKHLSETFRLNGSEWQRLASPELVDRAMKDMLPVEGVLVDLCLLLLAALEWLFAFLFAALGQCGMASASSIPPHILYYIY